VPFITIAILLVTVLVVDADTVIGKIIVVVPDTAGDEIVMLPLVEPLSTKDAII
jgi:hypothetical protein